MTKSLANGRNIGLDEDGFLREPEKWNLEVAVVLAQQQGIEYLTESHWRVVDSLREYYLDFGIPPPVTKLCKDTGFDLRRIYELFPSGLSWGAVKVAGLPRPYGLYPR